MQNVIAACLVFFIANNYTDAQTTVKYGADKTRSYITYTMTHPMHEWDGTSKDVNSVLLFNLATKKIEKVAVSVPISTFDSQNANRDSHTIEVLDAIKFPVITFSSTSIIGNDSILTITGNLVFHGVTRSIIFVGKNKSTDKGIEVAGTFNVKMSEYNIENPSLMGIPTKDEFIMRFFVVYYPK